MKKSKPQRHNGQVRWIDQFGGQGVIRVGATGESIPFYICNLLGAKTWFNETCCMTIEQGAPVEFEFHEALGAVKISGGTLDLEHWNRIKGQDLAFTCDSDGNATSGLFKGGAK